MAVWFRAAMAFFVTVAALAQSPPPSISIQWDTNGSSVRVVGAIPRDLQKLETEKLQEIFPVTIEPANVLSSIGLPPIIGAYMIGSNHIEFRPRYPFEPGVNYRASFTPAKASSVLRVPPRSQERTTKVTEVYPTADILPQNLLKFYLHFSASMSRGQIYEHIHLLNEGGTAVELPFLEIEEELWNPEMTRLTLFLDPGRIKRGVRPLEEVGPALFPEKSYTLVIEAEWHDARGVPLQEPFRKTFRVSPPDREPPDPAVWKINVPRSNTQEPVVMVFSDPMDQALALRMISVKDLAGRKSLRDKEREWVFTPDERWRAGRYELLVQSTIEDLAGNNIGKPFEVDLQGGDQPPEAPKTISLFFEVK